MYKKLTNCKYCNIILEGLNASERANHSRWCLLNPKRAEYVKTNSGKQLNTIESIKKRNLGIKKAWADGKYEGVVHSNCGYKHTDETKKLLREKALASPHRRLVRSLREYIKNDGTIVHLDSSWEEALAIRLDELGVNWSRPKPIQWIDENGVKHNYFPDFYLPDFDLYIDPKGPYAFKAQINKIKCLTEQVKNLIIITSFEECKNYNPTSIGDIC